MNNADKQCDIFTYHSESFKFCDKYCNHKLRMRIVHTVNGCNNRTVEWWVKSNCKRSCFDNFNQHRYTDNRKMIWKMRDWWYSNAKTFMRYTTNIHKLSKNFSICFKSIVELSSNNIVASELTLQHTSFYLKSSNKNLYGRKLWMPKGVSFETSRKMQLLR